MHRTTPTSAIIHALTIAAKVSEHEASAASSTASRDYHLEQASMAWYAAQTLSQDQNQGYIDSRSVAQSIINLMRSARTGLALVNKE